MNINIKLFILTLSFIVLSACSSVGAWEKGSLARAEMEFVPDLLVQRMDDHIYFSKEASSFGSAVSGGGCGCN